jgi:hypothetical protein
MIASSEVIPIFGSTETANDFVPSDTPIGHATWWGGYFDNSSPCQGIATPGFNLRFYADAGCAPGAVIADLSITQFTEESVGCQAGQYPLYKWGADVNVALTIGTKYWFGAQMKDHAFPPQAGRLASMGVVGCESMFKSAFFGFPDWTLVEDVFGETYDASQEFDGGPLPQACCFPDGHCEYTLSDQCTASGGVPQGPGSVCDPNPCIQPPGACCLADGSCVDVTAADCAAIGGVWEGYGTNCGTYQCPQPVGACCFPDGHCADLTPVECFAAGGLWEGNTDCAHFDCPQPTTGACCFGERCAVETQSQCAADGGSYQGDNTTCSPNNPCVISPTQPSTWGKIKGLYR